MKKKVDSIRELWAAGDYREAMKIAAQGAKLGDHRVAIQGGWAAAWNPGFYHQLGRSPDAMYKAGLRAMALHFGLEPAPGVD